MTIEVVAQLNITKIKTIIWMILSKLIAWRQCNLDMVNILRCTFYKFCFFLFFVFSFSLFWLWLIKNFQPHGTISVALCLTCVAWVGMVYAMGQVPINITSIPIKNILSKLPPDIGGHMSLTHNKLTLLYWVRVKPLVKDARNPKK